VSASVQIAGGLSVAKRVMIGDIFRIYNGSDYTQLAQGSGGSLGITTSNAVGSISIQPSGNLFLATTNGTSVQIGRTGITTSVTGDLVVTSTNPVPLIVNGVSDGGFVLQ